MSTQTFSLRSFPPDLTPGAMLSVEVGDNAPPLDVAVVEGAPNQADASHLSVKVVGYGSRAVVLEGVCQRSGLRVALKVLPPMGEKNAENWLRREVNVLRTQTHPFILPYLGTATWGLHHILVTQLMPKGNLMEFLEAEPSADRPRLVAEVAEALEFLHVSVNFIHGNVKGEHVLISDSCHALLAGFSLSTAIDKASTDPQTPNQIRERRTVAFTAPEILFDRLTPSAEDSSQDHVFGAPPETQPRRPKTPQSDVYAFGMLLLQVFTGASPWQGYEPTAILFRVSTGVTPRRPKDVDSLSDAYWSLCLACWRFDPESRPTISDVRVMLRAAHTSTATLDE